MCEDYNGITMQKSNVLPVLDPEQPQHDHKMNTAARRHRRP